MILPSYRSNCLALKIFDDYDRRLKIDRVAPRCATEVSKVDGLFGVVVLAAAAAASGMEAPFDIVDEDDSAAAFALNCSYCCGVYVFCENA